MSANVSAMKYEEPVNPSQDTYQVRWNKEDGKLGVAFTTRSSSSCPVVHGILTGGVVERCFDSVSVGDMLVGIDEADTSTMDISCAMKLLTFTVPKTVVLTCLKGSRMSRREHVENLWQQNKDGIYKNYLTYKLDEDHQ
ncbi:hypothetical protein LEN26_003714 [Aphanomyces euteiches]|nr:hypothetical protein LEN26_003714 [Aphanomyces euteiches]